MLNTRYLHEQTLELLGLMGDIAWLYGRAEWDTFISQKYNTYIQLTLEFLSSLEAEVLRGHHAAEGHITFLLFNIEHVLTLAELNSIYHFPPGGTRRISSDFIGARFWSEITSGAEYNSSNLKATALHNPCFRYM